MGLVIKAIVNRASGSRFEGRDLTPFLMEYAKNNRDEFSMIYQGDVVDETPTPADDDKAQDSRPVYTAGTLKAKFDKEGVKAILASMGIEIEGEVTKDAMIQMILAEQETQGKKSAEQAEA